MKRSFALILGVSVIAISCLSFIDQAHADTVYRFEQDIHYYVKLNGTVTYIGEESTSNEYRYPDNRPCTTYYVWHRNVYVLIDLDADETRVEYGNWSYQGSYTVC